MPVEFRNQTPSGGARILQVVTGVLNLVVLGMILYLRFGPFAQMLRRFEERGIAIPEWIPLAFNGGVLIVGSYLAYRGVAGIRNGLSRTGREG